MSFKKIMKSLPSDILSAKGLLYQDWPALTPCQRECTTRLGMTIQTEQEAYIMEHPEVTAMLELLISRMCSSVKRKDFFNEAADFFLKPIEKLDGEIRERLGISAEAPYNQNNKPPFKYKDTELENDLKKITMKYYAEASWKIPTPTVSTPDTKSSSFLSRLTSETTLPTPEPVKTPEPTMSENMFALISNTVDKAVFLHVDDEALRYDTAYMEVSKAVEEAMEIPVIEIREDIADLYYNAYKMFELNIMEKERIAAEIAWEKRMRKKMKRTLRRQKNFKGYETPATPKSELSSHESWKVPPPRPCKCHPQNHYNRYGKDRFGIYLPRDMGYSDNNVTVTPALSVESVTAQEEDGKADDTDTKSMLSKKSAISTKTAVDKKATFSR